MHGYIYINKKRKGNKEGELPGARGLSALVPKEAFFSSFALISFCFFLFVVLSQR
jgi:hypothetical protein